MLKTRILIVEDDEASASYMQDALRTSGYQITASVASGEQAVQSAAADPPEVVLMDIGLAGEIDGIEAAARIRANQNIPIIYLTVYAESDILERIKATDPFGYLLKPFQLQELRIAIDMALYKYKLENDLRETNRRLAQEISAHQQAEEVLRTHQIELEMHNEELDAAQKQICESQQKYMDLYDFAPVGYSLIDQNGRIVEANLTIANLLGVVRSNLINTRLYQYVAEEDRDRLFLHLKQLIRTNTRQTCEVRLIPPEGAPFWMQLDSIVADAREVQTGRYRIAFTDIAARKHVEEELQQYHDHLEQLVAERTVELTRSNERLQQEIAERKRMEQALRKNEQQYRTLAENVADGVAIVQEGKLVFANQSLAALLGYAKTQLLSLNFIDVLREDYKELGRQKIILAEQGLAESDWQAPYVMPDGREIWTETHYSLMEWDGGAAILVTIKDITAHKVHALVMERDRERLWQENLTLRTTIRERYRFGEIIGKSPAMQGVYELILKAAATNENVLIQGSSGTGKELIARNIHQISARRDRQFIPVNCGAIPENLFESEFFGYRKGAFTGAYANKPGLFDAAHQGTLFLDEVGELSPVMQVKLLRALDANGYTPVGAQTVKISDVRIIAATNRNLEELFRKGVMREDFFYRIHVITITVPPLRERREDIPFLIEHFLERLGNHATHAILPGDVLEQLYRYDWPGNVRELQSVLRRYVTIQELGFTNPFHGAPVTKALPAAGFTTKTDKLREAVEAFEQWFLARVLEQHRWHRTETAVALDIPTRTLHRKMKKYQLI